MCVDSIIANDYPKDRLEVLVADGMSEDGTRAIVEGYARRHSFIKLVDNPKKITPAALNVGVAQAKASIIVRMDAHSEYSSDYLKKTLYHLEKTGADNVGGIRITRPSSATLISKTIALMTSYPFGVSGARYRFLKNGGYVDTVPNGAFRKETFKRVGGFDEALVRNQDNEFNARIIKHGGRIFVSPEIKSYYYNQATIGGLLKQALRTGMWNVVTLKINPGAFRWRHFVPFIFTSTLLALSSLAPLSSWARLAFFILLGLYGTAAGISSVHIGLKEGMKSAGILPLLFFLYHSCYGLGTWAGLWRVVVSGWDGGADNEKQSNYRAGPSATSTSSSSTRPGGATY